MAVRDPMDLILSKRGSGSPDPAFAGAAVPAVNGYFCRRVYRKAMFRFCCYRAYQHS